MGSNEIDFTLTEKACSRSKKKADCVNVCLYRHTCMQSRVLVGESHRLDCKDGDGRTYRSILRLVGSTGHGFLKLWLSVAGDEKNGSHLEMDSNMSSKKPSVEGKGVKQKAELLLEGSRGAGNSMALEGTHQMQFWREAKEEQTKQEQVNCLFG